VEARGKEVLHIAS